MRKIVVLLAATTLCIGGATAAFAAADAASVIAARKAGMKKVGGAFKLIMGQVKAGSLDSSGTAATRELKALAAKTDAWFPAKTGPDVDSATRAKAELWTNRADFTAKAKAFAAATMELEAAAAKGGNVKAAAAKVGGTCKACHDSYREAY
ncbi:MAG TPA: cytochrome c [Sphingomicrobium sp.]|jgi:cytochrome c556